MRLSVPLLPVLFLLPALPLMADGPVDRNGPVTPGVAQHREATNHEEAQLEASAAEHFREELGVNGLTTPLVGRVFTDLELFDPPPVDLLRSFDSSRTFPDRFQTAIQFGALVANGFVATIARQQDLLLDTGRALVRNAGALDAGKRLTVRSKSLFELSDKGDWQGLRQELTSTQEDVEESMLELKDGELADLISLGGWLRGFQLACHVTSGHYSAEKAAALVRPGLMDYFIDRMDCLSPRMKSRPAVRSVTAGLKTIRGMTPPGTVPTSGDVLRLKELADGTLAAALTKDEQALPAATPASTAKP